MDKQKKYVPKRFYVSLPREDMLALARVAEEEGQHPKVYAARLISEGLKQARPYPAVVESPADADMDVSDRAQVAAVAQANAEAVV